MRRTNLSAALVLGVVAAGVPCIQSQTPIRPLDRLKLQVHGYAAQGFVYSTKNNWNLMDSTSGSAAWSDAVLNLTSQPLPKLRIGGQGRYFHLGGNQNKVSLDWAQADYKVNEYFGVRGGKVKTPVGLLNDSQDIDPAQLWVLLPQSVYPVASRNSSLAHRGGILYGDVSLGENFGKIEYRAFGGQRAVSGDDGYLQSIRDAGFGIPSEVAGSASGGSIHWLPPIRGLMLGASEAGGSIYGALVFGSSSGSFNVPAYHQLYYFGRLERGRFMAAGEYSRLPGNAIFTVAGSSTYQRGDARAFYTMTSYKPTNKLTAGIYYSAYTNRLAPYNSFRYQKDWALAGRYDFNTYVYAKLEQHFIDGNAIGISATDNTNLQPDNRMTMFKVGVSF